MKKLTDKYYFTKMRKTVGTIKKPKQFHLSTVSKMSNSKNNAFGLPAGPEFSCPEATTACINCYALKGRSLFTNVQNSLASNYTLWKYYERRKNITTASNKLLDAIDPDTKLFRINYSGDINSQHAIDVWTRVIRSRPQTYFWLYTRSFNFNYAKLVRLKNAALWASTDEYNTNEASKFVKRYSRSNVKHAYGPWLGGEVPNNSFICPAIIKKIPTEGACEKCMLCVVKDRTHKNVIFPRH